MKIRPMFAVDNNDTHNRSTITEQRNNIKNFLLNNNRIIKKKGETIDARFRK